MEPDLESRPGEPKAPEKNDPSLLSVTLFGGVIASLCCLLVALLASL